ncbi:BlaI/MecI/CopY family transcriptional regulator [Methyloradius palustris]|uniref:Uncharacterized protein n=1 Tax=Methyloradius palustris TaxID=2778876 RepID=A0A8D5FZR0_9PROT|nr:BlaI/MecI/CopY family transcriptional regulator [Methyloradius palustris]BCM25157.1 hypothetical protein ZMTM_14160 [Methyloradius palustris]
MGTSSSIENLEKIKAIYENKLRHIREQLRDLNAKYEKVLIAIEVLQETDSDNQSEPKPAKKTPIRVHVMNIFDDGSTLTVSDVFDDLPEEVNTTKATINTVLSELVKAGKLQKRGVGQYYKPAQRKRLIKDWL